MAGALRLQLHVRPRARRSRIAGSHADGLKVEVMAPPVEGAANAAVIDLVARSFGVPRRRVHLIQGAGSRQKVIEIEDGDTPEHRLRLEELRRSR
jgi:uncharacterized protein (TIGR00251 family)